MHIDHLSDNDIMHRSRHTECLQAVPYAQIEGEPYILTHCHTLGIPMPVLLTVRSIGFAIRVGSPGAIPGFPPLVVCHIIYCRRDPRDRQLLFLRARAGEGERTAYLIYSYIRSFLFVPCQTKEPTNLFLLNPYFLSEIICFLPGIPLFLVLYLTFLSTISLYTRW
jgi:hypothetical protein